MFGPNRLYGPDRGTAEKIYDAIMGRIAFWRRGWEDKPYIIELNGEKYIDRAPLGEYLRHYKNQILSVPKRAFEFTLDLGSAALSSVGNSLNPKRHAIEFAQSYKKNPDVRRFTNGIGAYVGIRSIAHATGAILKMPEIGPAGDMVAPFASAPFWSCSESDSRFDLRPLIYTFLGMDSASEVGIYADSGTGNASIDAVVSSVDSAVNILHSGLDVAREYSAAAFGVVSGVAKYAVSKLGRAKATIEIPQHS